MQTTNIHTKAPERRGEKGKSASDLNHRANESRLQPDRDTVRLEKHQVDLQWGELDQQPISNIESALLSSDCRSLVPGGRRYENDFGRRPPGAFSFRSTAELPVCFSNSNLASTA